MDRALPPRPAARLKKLVDILPCNPDEVGANILLLLIVQVFELGLHNSDELVKFRPNLNPAAALCRFANGDINFLTIQANWVDTEDPKIPAEEAQPVDVLGRILAGKLARRAIVVSGSALRCDSVFDNTRPSSIRSAFRIAFPLTQRSYQPKAAIDKLKGPMNTKIRLSTHWRFWSQTFQPLVNRDRRRL